VYHVSALGSVHTLNLRLVTGLVLDLVLRFGLGLGIGLEIKLTLSLTLTLTLTLTLRSCQGVSDVSGLSNVHTLDISRCGGIRYYRVVRVRASPLLI
jgi:hypothetical protein